MAVMTYNAYCVKCRETHDMDDVAIVTTDSGRTKAQGTCPRCGGKMMRLLR